MLSKLVGDVFNTGAERAIILQHRDELTKQNRATFHKVNPQIGASGVINSNQKQFSSNVAFAMVPTLARNMQYLRAVDIAVVDEAHHTAAASYGRVLEALQELNPEMLLAGFTATPKRGDKASLTNWFSNVADHISLQELVRSGVLVNPRCFVIDLGVQEDLAAVKRNVSDFDMSEVAKIMDHTPLNKQVVQKWKDQAGDRQTVVFCSTVEHAGHITDEFREAGVAARLVWGDMPEADRRDTLADFDKGLFQVVVNVAVLTEGWDCQPVDCVVLLRPCSYKGTMIQMIGRGLRRLDPELYPGRRKSDCIVLDFGTSIITHGSLEVTTELDPEQEKEEGQPEFMRCPGCGTLLPGGSRECPICGHSFVEERQAAADLAALTKEHPERAFELREIQLLDASPFRWETFWDGAVMIANGFNAWGMTVWYQGEWHSLGATKGEPLKHLSRGDKLLCLAVADDFIRSYEEEDTAHKSRRWLHLQPTDNQLRYLNMQRGQAYDLNRYKASCLLTWKFNEQRVQAKLGEANRQAA